MVVFCDDTTCQNCDSFNTKCKLPAISLEVREGEFKNGKREVFNACVNYKERNDGEN